VAASISNPVVHYVTHRHRQNLAIRGVDWQRQRTVLLDSGYFDPDWYLRTHLDVAEAALDPLDHYLEFGGSEARSPSQYFNARLYLSDHPEVSPQAINPLIHYLQHGAAATLRSVDHSLA
jgi:hypothetical protein